MPCDTITTQSVALKNAIPELVEDSLKELGWQITTSTKTVITARKSYENLTWTKGSGIQIRGSSNQYSLQDITKQYSKQAVSWAAQRAGWQVKSTGANTLNVTRR